MEKTRTILEQCIVGLLEIRPGGVADVLWGGLNRGYRQSAADRIVDGIFEWLIEFPLMVIVRSLMVGLAASGLSMGILQGVGSRVGPLGIRILGSIVLILFFGAIIFYWLRVGYLAYQDIQNHTTSSLDFQGKVLYVTAGILLVYLFAIGVLLSAEALIGAIIFMGFYVALTIKLLNEKKEKEARLHQQEQWDKE
jgi:hypothetical protein